MPEEPEKIEIPEERKDIVWNAGFNGEPFPSFAEEIPEEELKHLKRLYNLAREEGLVDVKKLFGKNTKSSAKDYKIVRELGAGTFGTVYLAIELSVKKEVAIKILTSEFAKKRSKTEGQAGANINSPFVVRTHRLGPLDDGSLYIVMDYVKGDSLATYIKPGKPLEKSLILQGCKWFEQSCKALKEATTHGITHRDLKPFNILIDSARKEVLICDFGIASFYAGENPPTGSPGDETSTSGTQGFLGTFAYSAPEQVRKAVRADLRSDMYSLGASFYHLFTGRLPTGDRKPDEIERLHLEFKTPVPEAPHKRNPDLPIIISNLILWLLKADPADRPESFDEILKGSSPPTPDSWKGLTPFIKGAEFKEEPEKYGCRARADGNYENIPPPELAKRGGPSFAAPAGRQKDGPDARHPSSFDKKEKDRRKTKPVKDPEQASSGPKGNHTGPVEMAKKFREEDDPDTALKILDMVIREDSENIEALLLQAEILLERDRDEK